MFADPTGGGPTEFVLLRPFVPVLPRRRAHRAAGVHDGVERSRLLRPADRLRRPGAHAGGPRTVSNQIDSEPTITQQITLQTGGGNRVRFGDLQLVPVADGLLWVRPFYAAVPQSSDRDTTVTGYRFVIVSYDTRAAFGESLGEALGKLFPGFEGDLGDRVGADGTTTEDGEDDPPATGEPTGDDPAELLAEADQLLADADAALDARDLGEYQAKVDEAKELIDQALELLEPQGG